MSARRRRQSRKARREFRREAFAFIRENDDWDQVSLKEHLEDEFSPLLSAGTFDISFILEIIKLILALFNRD